MAGIPQGGRFDWTDWGLPDWTADWMYQEHLDDWDDSRWRWEFLRRRDDYRADFQSALATVAEPFESIDLGPEWVTMMVGDGMRALPFDHVGAYRYQLHQFFDPVISNWCGLGPEWHSGLVFGGFDRTDYAPNAEGVWEEIEARHMVAFTFDLRRPITPQLAEAKLELKNEQARFYEDLPKVKAPKAAKHHRDKWPVYLRALDARAAGASYSQIAEILPPTYGRRDPQTAHNVVAQAEALKLSF